MDEARGILYVAWWTDGLKAIDVSGELLGLFDAPGHERLVGSIIYGNTALRGDDLARSWGAQLHDGLVYVSEVSEGLWIFRPEFLRPEYSSQRRSGLLALLHHHPPHRVTPERHRPLTRLICLDLELLILSHHIEEPVVGFTSRVDAIARR